MSSSQNEKTVASSGGFCTAVVVFNRGVEFAYLSGQSYISQFEYC
jgi:hypothetical protein